MTSVQHKPLTEIVVEELMISSEKVAHVQLANPLEHALLVLVKSGYSAVPVLDTSYKLKGTIGKTVILNHILGIERFEMERLSKITVNDVMQKDVPCLKKSDSFLVALKAVIDYPFVCVADEEGYFDGILTRRAILKQLNKDLHANKSKTE
ncbi:CBS domain-containing protein [Aquibacillus sp. 3ASR75-11]|uniref:CBS domain-containing protein n=1 Tax=Terrihalobacillus insolitus TaxID=2950438 RepID=A0A9X3WSC0_9BACI|nr:cyclic-di-AMP-binding protein CbpB [Terrihalobacillus insolitus]MDC3412755.1 CBS domain-containing protein [Terrihalobacillus insolitus]MDC3423768.1 CBS domain-containing protein [Terrihalobacillus insolitus]